MLCNMLVSSMAMSRFNERQMNIEAHENWQIWMDEHYNDNIMNRIYPNAQITN